MSLPNVSRIYIQYVFLLVFTLCLWFSAPVYAEKIPTQFTLTVTPVHPAQGVPYSITGVLSTSSGEPLGNKKVALEATSRDPEDESSFAFIAMDDTGRGGDFSFFRPMMNAERAVRVVYHGNSKYDAAVSPVCILDTSPLPVGGGTGKTGSLLVRSDPDSAVIFLDGNESGITPTTITHLPEGSHEMIVAKDGFQNETVDVFVVPGETASVSVSLNPIGIGLTKSGVTATLAVGREKIIPMSDPVFTYTQNNLDLNVYRNSSSSSSPQVTTIYSTDPWRKGYSLSVLISDDT